MKADEARKLVADRLSAPVVLNKAYTAIKTAAKKGQSSISVPCPEEHQEAVMAELETDGYTVRKYRVNTGKLEVSW